MLEKRSRSVAVLCLLVCSHLILSAQVRVGSPYSRFGIGDLHRLSNARNLSMGGTSLAMRDKAGINYLNPASYTAFDSLSFVFEGGVIDHYAITKTNDLSAKNNYISLGYLLFGFPVTSWWRASFGLLPFSDIGYNIVDEETLPEAGPVSYLFKGNGGINQFYFGSGFRLHKNLSAGINFSYLFGTLEKNRTVYFSDTSNAFNLRYSDRTNYGDFLPSIGLQYHTKLPKKHFLIIGANYGPQTDLAIKNDQVVETFITGSTGIEFIKDTISNVSNRKGNVTLPGGFGAGFTYGETDHWLATAEVKMQNWENYRYFDLQDSLKNSFQVAAGFSITPDANSISNYWKKVTYRMGMRYGATYLQLRENQLSEIGISFGLGLPLRRSQSMLNLGFEYGRRGTTADDLIQENFFRIVLGVSVYERWFQQRRYE